MLQEQQSTIGVGGYLENRVIYNRSTLFAEADYSRSIHLGVDIWAPASTLVQVSIPGFVHSFQDNARFGDYGPTIILEHSLHDLTFYTLYGHLSRQSLNNLQIGQHFHPGDTLAEIGHFPENGD